MTRFRALVVDDEPLARTMVAEILRRDPDVEAVVECGDASGARTALAGGRVDIAFLDIDMPDVSGLELAAAARAEQPVVVFVTAFSQYAPNAFDVDAIDYVLKPFSDARLLEALERAKRRVRERRLGELAEQMATLSAELKSDTGPAAPERLDRLTFKRGDRSIFLNVSEILWIEAEDYYVRVHSKTGAHLVRATLTSLEERLDARTFMRVHRAAIVNVDEVHETYDEGGLVLVLTDGSSVAVSRSRRRAVEDTLLPRLRPSRKGSGEP